MQELGTVESLWRYPVKSMAGHPVPEAFLGFAGIFGDRCWAIHDTAARAGLPYLTASTLPSLLLHRPRFRWPERAALPPNLEQAVRLPPGATPQNGTSEDLAVDILTPSGATVPLEEPTLLQQLASLLGPEHRLTLVHSHRALGDCRPISLISAGTIAAVSSGAGMSLDARRFRANIYTAWSAPLGEDGYLGRRIQLGERAVIYLLERDPRCKMISLDPDTAAHHPQVLRHVAQQRETFAGLYAAVLVEGVVRPGDPILLLD